MTEAKAPTKPGARWRRRAWWVLALLVAFAGYRALTSRVFRTDGQAPAPAFEVRQPVFST